MTSLRSGLLGLCILLGSCGARSGLGTGMDAAADDGGARDGGLDGRTRDGGPAPGCAVGDPVVIVSEGAPAFVYSLAAVDGGRRYAVGHSVGWPPDVGGRIGVLGPDLHLRSSDTASQPDVYVAADPASDEAFTVEVGEHEWHITKARLRGERLATEAEVGLMCDYCTTYGSGLAVGPDRIAVMVRGPDSMVAVLLLDRRSFAEGETATFDGGFPTLVTVAGRLFYAALGADGRIRMGEIDWAGGGVTRVDTPLSAAHVPLALGTLDDRILLAFWREDQHLAVAEVTTPELTVLRTLDLGEIGLPSNMVVDVSDRTVAIAWGQMLREVGQHAAVLDRTDLGRTLLPPSLMGPDTGRGTSSYSVWVGMAPHPDGHALVWGGWLPEPAYGVFGLIFDCRP